MRRHETFDELGLLRNPLTSWRNGMAEAERVANRSGRSRLQVAQAVDCADWLPNDLLTKLDRCLMANGIEGRTPFLDPHVAAFAYCLPDHRKVRDGLGKYTAARMAGGTCTGTAEPFSKKRGFTPCRSANGSRNAGRLSGAAGGVARMYSRDCRNRDRSRCCFDPTSASEGGVRGLVFAILCVVAPTSHPSSEPTQEMFLRHWRRKADCFESGN